MVGEGGRGRLDPSAVARSTARTPSRARHALAAPVQKFCLSSYVRNGSYAIDDEGIIMDIPDILDSAWLQL